MAKLEQAVTQKVLNPRQTKVKEVNTTEYIIGIAGIVLLLVAGKIFLKSDILFFRLLVGAGLGYALTRAYSGFAGSINRAYITGSTKLMRALMFMFFITSIVTTAFLFKADSAVYQGLWVNPINFGLILGAILFGFGMSFSSCCASGVLTDLVTALPRAFITLVFFAIGIFFGFPIQKTASWVRQSWFATAVGEQSAGGVFLPDLFMWDGTQGYLGGILLTGLFCTIVVTLAYKYEKYRKDKTLYVEHPTEKLQDTEDKFDSKDYKFFSQEAYNRFFVKPWTLKQGAVVISILFALLMGVTKSGWGASTPYGLWFGKLLMAFGISADSLAEFTKMPAAAFSTPFFEHGVSVQNFGIVVGTMIYLLTAGIFTKTFTSELKVTTRDILLFALGGITMGFGTRFANGCNVGALYTPIANFSLSGWIFLIFMIVGGIIGNKIAKRCRKAAY